MSASIHCEPFDAHGRTAEASVEFNVNRVGDKVFVYIMGTGPAKQFGMSVHDWCQLDQAVTEGPRP